MCYGVNGKISCMPDFNYIFNSPFLNIDGDQDGGNSHIEPINFCPIFIPLFECQVSGVRCQCSALPWPEKRPV